MAVSAFCGGTLPAAVATAGRLYAPLEAPRLGRAGWWRMATATVSPRLLHWAPLPLQPRAQSHPTEAATETMRAVEERLEVLRGYAGEDGIVYSEASEAGLRAFLSQIASAARPALYLLDDGAIRAEWKNLTGEQVALEFVDARRARLVLFARRGGGEMSRTTGQDSVAGAAAQIEALGLRHLITG